MGGLKTNAAQIHWLIVFVGAGALCSTMFLLVNLERLVVTFIYLANRDQYSFKSYEIADTYYRIGRKGKTTILAGHIDGVEVETTPKFLDVPYKEIQSLRNGTSDGLIEPVLFAPSLYDSHRWGPTRYAVLRESFAASEYPHAIANATALVLPPLLLWIWLIRAQIQMNRVMKAMREKYKHIRQRRRW